MKYLKKNNKIFLFLFRPVIWCIIFGMTVSPPLLYPAGKAADKKLQIEIYGGFSSLKPGDLNLLPETDAQTQEFLYEGFNNFMYDNRYIVSWSGSSDGEYQKITTGIPLGLRIKYYLTSSLSLSVGFRTITGTKNSDPSFQYNRTQTNGNEFLDKKEYSLYTLSARGYAPLVGVHLEMPMGSGISVEGYAAGGPLFARCRYAAQWRSELSQLNTDPDTILYEEDGSLEQEGKGTGFAFDGGVRINVSLGNHLGIFLGAGYVYQSASNISGKGKEVIGNNTREWDDRWAIKREHLVSFWGEQVLEFPTNYWLDETGGTRARDFTLDLSGFQLQLGLFYRF